MLSKFPAKSKKKKRSKRQKQSSPVPRRQRLQLQQVQQIWFSKLSNRKKNRANLKPRKPRKRRSSLKLTLILQTNRQSHRKQINLKLKSTRNWFLRFYQPQQPSLKLYSVLRKPKKKPPFRMMARPQPSAKLLHSLVKRLKLSNMKKVLLLSRVR